MIGKNNGNLRKYSTTNGNQRIDSYYKKELLIQFKNKHWTTPIFCRKSVRSIYIFIAGKK